MGVGVYLSAISGWYQPQVDLSVRIETGPGWVHDAVVRAMTEWNRQETAFIKEYYPNESYALVAGCAANPAPACLRSGSINPRNSFVLYEDESAVNPMVSVIFSPVHSVQTSSMELTCSGSELAVTGFDGSRFTISVLSALTNVADNATSRDVLYRVMLHEFGHVMGLGHIFDGKDIMDGTAYFIRNPARQSFISTTDLYAIRELAESAGSNGAGSSRISFIALPASIPYDLVNVSQPYV